MPRYLCLHKYQKIGWKGLNPSELGISNCMVSPGGYPSKETER